MRVAVQNLRRCSDARRYAVMVLTLLDLEKALVDDALDMHDRIMTRVLRQCKQRQAESLQSDAKQIKQALGMFASLGKALIEARDQQREPWQSIEAVLSWDTLCAMIDTIETLGQPRRLDGLGYVDAFYPQVRRYVPMMLEELDFHAAAGGEGVLAAIRLL